MTQLPYQRIVGDLRRQIDAGELLPGDRVPSTRRIAQEWGVAMVTAAKALTSLRQEGLVQALPRVGTVVAEPKPVTRPARATSTEDERNRERVVRAAITLADTEGLAALSMRRIATDVGMATMSLYRYVHGKDDLLVHMLDIAFGEHPLPATPPADWRAALEFVMRAQWAIYRRHPWVAKVLSFTRPQLAPNGMAFTEWSLEVLSGYALDFHTRLYLAVTTANYVRGTAVNLETEAEAHQDTGLTSDQWMAQHDSAFDRIMASGRFPRMAEFSRQPDVYLDLDTLFEFGMQRLLDGIGQLLSETGQQR